MKRFGNIVRLFVTIAITMALSSAAFAGGPPPTGDPAAKQDAMSISMGSVKILSANMIRVSGNDQFNVDAVELTVTNPKEGAVRQLLVFGSHPDFCFLSHLKPCDWVKFTYMTDQNGGPIDWRMENLPAGYLRLGKGPAQRDLMMRAQAEADAIAEVGEWRIRPLVQSPTTNTKTPTRLVILFQNGSGGNVQVPVYPNHRQYSYYRSLDPYTWTRVGTSRAQSSMGPTKMEVLDWIRVEGPGKG